MWRDRILDDGTDREAWERHRYDVIGASDVKSFARIESAPAYFRSKIAARSFHGNAYTERGHEFEPVLIAATGVPPSSALIHAPGESGFAATPDGVAFDAGELAEAKLRHGKIASGPSMGEWRQLAWQFYCVPEAVRVRFVEGEVLPSPSGWRLRREPQVMTIERDDPRIAEAIAQVLPIARVVLPLVVAHREMEREFAHG